MTILRYTSALCCVYVLWSAFYAYNYEVILLSSVQMLLSLKVHELNRADVYTLTDILDMSCLGIQGTYAFLTYYTLYPSRNDLLLVGGSLAVFCGLTTRLLQFRSPARVFLHMMMHFSSAFCMADIIQNIARVIPPESLYVESE